MTRPARRALLVVLLVLAPLLAAAGAPSVAPAAGAAEADAEPVVLRVDALSPSVATTGSTLRVAGRVANVGRQALRDVEVRLRLSDTRLTSRAQLDSVARGETTTLDGDAVAAQGLADVAPGQTAAFELTRSADELAVLTESGVHVLAVEVLATRGSGFGRVAIQRTLLPWNPADPALKPTGFSWLWPLVSRPTRLADGTFADDSLAAEMTDGGRLQRLVQAGVALSQGAALTWVVDPELVAAAEDMADGYRVRTPDGSVVRGEASEVAGAWLESVRAATASRPVVALPYGDAAVSEVVRADLSGDVPAVLELGVETLHRVLPAAGDLAGTVWPVDGYVSRAALAALVRADTTTVVLDGRAVPLGGDLSFTPSGRADLRTPSGPVRAVLADPGLADLLRFRGPDPLLGAQRFLAETAMITSELPTTGTSRAIVLAPPKRWDPDPVFLDRLVAVGAQAPWMAPVSLRVLAGTDPPAVDRQRLQYPAGQRRRELPGTYLTAVAGMHTSINLLSAVLTDREQLVPELQRSALLLESAWWRGREARANRLARERGHLAETRGLVRIQSANFTFSSRKGTIPLTVANGLEQEVVVDVRLVPQTPRIQIDDIEPRVIGAQTKVQIEVPATAVASGPVVVEATLRTPGGALYGQPEQLRITITQYGTVALYITVAAAAVLFVAAGVRVLRRVLGAGRPTDPTPAEPADAAPTGTGPSIAAEVEQTARPTERAT